MYPTPTSPASTGPTSAATGSEASSNSGFVLTNPEPTPVELAHVGELLGAARVHAGLSVVEVANRLRMSVKQIEALERADYSQVPSGTFLRGFVRNYAKAVGASHELAVALLERTHPDGVALRATNLLAPKIEEAPVTLQSPGEALTTPRARAALACLLALFIGAVGWYWWVNIRPHLADGGRAPAPEPVVQPTLAPASPPTLDQVSGPPIGSLSTGAASASASASAPSGVVPEVSLNNSGATAANAPAKSADVAVAAASLTSPTTTVGTLPAPSPSPPSATAPTSVSPARANRAGDSGVIGFTFAGESWVEVVDGTGRTVLSRRYKAGEADEVSGRGPFSIVVGNAQVTRMAYNGREFDLKPHTKSTVARVNVK